MTEQAVMPFTDQAGDMEEHLETEGAGDNEEEDEPANIASSPATPTAKEVQDDEIAQIPFRSWCKLCVIGQGHGPQNRAAQSAAVPILGPDDFYITKDGIRKKEELEWDQDVGEPDVDNARMDGEMITCLIIKCLEDKITFAHCIPCKGTDEDMY